MNEDQKRALIFIKETGAIDNSAHRQLNSIDPLKASADLRVLRKKEILDQKGKGKATYYVPGKLFSGEVNEPVLAKSEPVANTLNRSEPVQVSSEPVYSDLVNQLPKYIQEQLPAFQGRIPDKEALEDFICDLCFSKEFSISQLSKLLHKGEKYLLFNFIKPLRESKRLEYTIPEMPNHPQQAYKTIKNRK